MIYTLSFTHPRQQLISVKILSEGNEADSYVDFHLPKWRPGRYTLQNFVQNLSDVRASDLDGTALPVEKVSTHTWRVSTRQQSSIILEYVYYANQTDAGSSFFDENWIYLNGITCLMYRSEQIDAACTLQFELPADFQLAGYFPNEASPYHFDSFHHLVDTPFFTARHLLQHSFELSFMQVYVHFLGDCEPDWPKIEHEIRLYSEAQYKLFETCPTEQFHYLFIALPFKARHGVEHLGSTVITLGPGHQMMQPELYRDFIAISSHEFFHLWNVKTLKPQDIAPYDYGRENYSRLHYVTEGVTSYYGDLMLWKSGVWNHQDWMLCLNEELIRFYQAGGKDYVSLSDASFDSWVNGYHNDGIPNRKISFYNKGFLVAMLLDFELRAASNHAVSLDHVIYSLYHEIAVAGKAYTEEAFWEVVERLSGASYAAFRAKYIDGTEALNQALSRMAEFYGLSLFHMDHPRPSSARYGLILTHTATGSSVIERISPDSPAYKAGLHVGDELISINGFKVAHNTEELLRYFQDNEALELYYFHMNRLQKTRLPGKSAFRKSLVQLQLSSMASETQKSHLSAWRKVKGHV